MKKIITLFLATGLVASAFAQDAMQPQGSWYLGTADATEIFQLFSDDGMNMSADFEMAIDLVVSMTAEGDSQDLEVSAAFSGVMTAGVETER